MAVVSEIFDSVKDLIGTCLDGYKELENPFIPEDNASNLWNKAFGVAFANGSNLELFAGCSKISCQRAFAISLVNKLNVTQNNIDKKDNQQKSIIEDMMKIKACFEGCPTLDSICTKAVFVADGGVEFIDGQRGKYFLVEAAIDVTFFDTI